MGRRGRISMACTTLSFAIFVDLIPYRLAIGSTTQRHPMAVCISATGSFPIPRRMNIFGGCQLSEIDFRRERINVSFLIYCFGNDMAFATIDGAAYQTINKVCLVGTHSHMLSGGIGSSIEGYGHWRSMVRAVSMTAVTFDTVR
jgi:hypothetical protein